MTRRAPGPGTLGTLRTLLSARGDITSVMTALQQRHGDVVRAKAGPSTFYLLGHPDHIEDVLVTNAHKFERVIGERIVSGRLVDQGLFVTEGEEHLRQRSLMEPVMYEHAPAVLARHVSTAAGKLREQIVAGKSFDLFAFTESFTTAIMVKLLFGKEPDDEAGERLARSITAAITTMDALPLPFSKFPERYARSRRRFDLARRQMDFLIFEVIAERRKAPVEDVTSMLVATGDAMTDAERRDHLISLFRGHQAVSTALTWTIMALAGQADIQSAMHAEIDGLGDRLPTTDDTERLDLTRRVFAESLRLYPPAYVLARTSIADHEVGGFLIPSGSRVLVSEWVTHRDPRFWDAPSRFDPSRFTGAIGNARHPFAYFPQGAGKKMCMGRHLVIPFEGPLLLATIAQRWRFSLDPSKKVVMSPKATLKPKKGVWVIAERR